MRRRGAVFLISGLVLVAPFVTAAPAHALCWFRCPAPTTTTTPPPPPPTPPPPAPTPPPPPPAPAPLPPSLVSLPDLAQQFLDLTNGARAAAGIGPVSMRADVVPMALAHSLEMAQQGTIWHGSFVTEATLHSLNAQSIGENVGMGESVGSIQDAFMASQHHRDNILDANFTQAGYAVVANNGTYFITEDFVQPRGGAPAPTTKPVAPRRSTSGYVSSAAPARPQAKASTPASVLAAAAPPATAPPTQGVVNAVTFDDSPSAVAAPAHPLSAGHQGSADWRLPLMLAVGLVGVTSAGRVRVRVRRARR